MLKCIVSRARHRVDTVKGTEGDEPISELRNHNSKIAILRFPPEILSKISLDLKYKFMVDERSTRPHAWIRIAHVCYLWREAVLQSPQFWATFRVSSPEVTREFLKRSKVVPLAIKVQSQISSYFKDVKSPPAPEDSLVEVFRAFPRIQDIELNLTLHQYNQLQIRPGFPRDVQNLHSITLRREMQGNSDTVAGWTIPSIFDSCPVPAALTHLTIEKYAVNWGNHLFAPTITHLVINCFTATAYGMGDIFDSLRKMPNLVHLSLSFTRTSKGLTARPPKPAKPVNLPKLSYLFLCDTVTFCAHILPCLDFPSTTVLNIKIPDLKKQPDVAPLGPVIFQKLTRDPSLPPIMTAGLWQQFEYPTCDHVGVHMSFWRKMRTTNYHPVDGYKEQPPLHIHIAGRFPKAAAAIFQELPLFAPLRDVQILFLGGANWGFKSPWKATLAQMPSIETLYLWSIDIKTFLRHLAAAIPDTREAAATLPKLQELILEKIGFNGTMLSRLPTVCENRQNAGYGPKVLRFKECSNMIMDREWKRCRPFVGELDWDDCDDINSSISDSEEEPHDQWDYSQYLDW